MNLEPVIGLEVHVQLGTRSKLFCACAAAFAGAPNSRICPVCTGQPGVLPVLNAAALELAVRAGLALGCTVRPRTRFDRKNYFYPDLPKGYQISQYDAPLAGAGVLEFERPDGSVGRSRIQRVHVEEDAGKALHPEGADSSQVDLNRAGIPLIEIVGEPDLRSPADAAAFLTALRRTLRHARVSECDLEKGSMRCDANVSVRPAGATALGTKVELKNINSMRNVERALHFEIGRQTGLCAAGRAAEIVQETRGFRDADGTTVSLRRKEEADDYRYFPDPDLPPVVVSPALLAAARAALGEDYRARRERYRAAFGLPDQDARVLAEEPDLADWFEEVVRCGTAPSTAAHWVRGELLGWLAESRQELRDLRVPPAGLAALVALVEAGRLSHQAGKRVWKHMLQHGRTAPEAVADLDLGQIQDEAALAAAVDEVLRVEARSVADYRAGKEAALNALLGRTMRLLQGRGEPQRIRALLLARLAPPG